MKKAYKKTTKETRDARDSIASYGRVAKVGIANQSEWERLCQNRELIRAVDELHGESKPVPNSATDTESHARRLRLITATRELAKRFSIPQRLYSYLEGWVVRGRVPDEVIDYSIPYPQPFLVDGQERLGITPETDFLDPMVLKGIRKWQLNAIDKPPQPTKGENNKLDWLPVWEWNLRHPGITRTELAKMLGRNAIAVRRELELCDNDRGTKGKQRFIPHSKPKRKVTK